jgi:hypothetical protein
MHIYVLEGLLVCGVSYMWWGLKRRGERPSFNDKAITLIVMAVLALAAVKGY